MEDGAQEQQLNEIESAHPEGMSVQQIVQALAESGERLTEATFRKYVQMGLLPRSVRVGRKGKRRGSQGLYPATTVRQVRLIRRLMGQGFTIEEIQRRFLLVRGEIDALSQQFERVLSQLESAVSGEHGAATPPSMLDRELEEASKLSEQLFGKLREIERRLALKVRMERAAV